MKKSGLSSKLLSGLLSLTIVSAGAVMVLPNIQDSATVVNAAAGERYYGDNVCCEETGKGTYKLISYNIGKNTPDRIEIPDTFNDKIVTTLCFDMFVIENGFSADNKSYDIKIGKNIRSIESYALRGINIRSIEVDPDNKYFAVYGGILCSKDGRHLYCCPNVRTGTVTLPRNVLTIHQGAFEKSKAKKLIFGAYVQSIPEDFAECCPKLEEYEVNETNNTFGVHEGVLVSKNKKILYAYPAAKAGEYIVPDSLNSIKNKAFSTAASLTGIDLKNTANIGSFAFAGCTGLKSLTIPGSVKTIGDSAFTHCKGITTVSFADSIKQIPGGMFSGCTSLAKFNVPSSLTSVGFNAFNSTAWYRNHADGYVYVGKKVLYAYKNSKGGTAPASNLNIPEGVAGVTDFALNGSNTVSISIPSTLRTLSRYAFYPRANVTEYKVSSNNTAFTASEGILFSKNMATLIAVPTTYKSKEYIVPASVTKIGDEAFAFNKNITEIVVSQRVKTFGAKPFNNGNSNRAVVCIKGSAVENAALNDGVRVIYDTPETTISKSEITIGVGETYQLSAKAYPEYLHSAIQWKTGNTGVATVKNGLVTAKGTGYCTIGAVNEQGVMAKCRVNVKKAPTKISLDKTSLTLGVGERITLKTTIDPGSASAHRIYLSSDEKAVSIDKSKWECTIKAEKPGKSVITVKLYNGISAKCTVTVKEAPKSIALSESEVTIGVGETVLLTSKPDDGAAATGRSYTSSNSNVAEINPTSWNCSFTGVHTGTAKIKVTTYNGKSSICNVTVKSPPKAVKISKYSVTLGVGETMKLSCGFYDDDYARSVKFTSDNSSVVSILKNGHECEFKALKEGTARLTVKTYNGQTAECEVIVKPSPKAIYLSRGLITMKVGETAQLNSYLDDGYAASNRTYRTSNEKVVQMLSTYWVGKIKAVAPGTAYVTVRTQTGVEKSCKIVVEE